MFSWQKKRRVSSSRARKTHTKSAGNSLWPTVIAVLAIVVLAIAGVSMSKGNVKDADAAPAPTQTTKTIYISRFGNDTNDGTTFAKPVKTLTQAFDLALPKGTTSMYILGYKDGDNDSLYHYKWEESVNVLNFDIKDGQIIKMKGMNVATPQLVRMEPNSGNYRMEFTIYGGQLSMEKMYFENTILLVNSATSRTGYTQAGVSKLSLTNFGATNHSVLMIGGSGTYPIMTTINSSWFNNNNALTNAGIAPMLTPLSLNSKSSQTTITITKTRFDLWHNQISNDLGVMVGAYIEPLIKAKSITFSGNTFVTGDKSTSSDSNGYLIGIRLPANKSSIIKILDDATSFAGFGGVDTALVY